MGEPLKDKIFIPTGIVYNRNKPIVVIDDIKSAVEWLKEQLIDKMETKLKGKVCYPYLTIGDTIDKAFPDLQEIKPKAKEDNKAKEIKKATHEEGQTFDDVIKEEYEKEEGSIEKPKISKSAKEETFCDNKGDSVM